MNGGKDNFEKRLDKILRGNHLKNVSNQGIRSLHSNFSILTINQATEIILNLAVAITSFTDHPEKYCEIWHNEIGKDIEGIKSMLAILERAYENANSTLYDSPKI